MLNCKLLITIQGNSTKDCNFYKFIVSVGRSCCVYFYRPQNPSFGNVQIPGPVKCILKILKHSVTELSLLVWNEICDVFGLRPSFQQFFWVLSYRVSISAVY